MSDEGKALLESLSVMYNRFCEKYPGDTQLITEAYDKIRQLIQPKPEIDEKYIDGKVMELYRLEFTTGQAKKFITQIINEVRAK